MIIYNYYINTAVAKAVAPFVTATKIAFINGMY